MKLTKIACLAALLVAPALVLAEDEPMVTVVPAASAPEARDFEFRPVGGIPFRLASLRGRPVLLKFWATWCPDCVREMPRTEELVAAYAPRGVEFLGVSTDTKKTADEVLAFFREKGQRYPLMVDASKDVKTLWEINWIPTVVLIDPTGRVRAVAKDLDGENLAAFTAVVDQVLGEGAGE